MAKLKVSAKELAVLKEVDRGEFQLRTYKPGFGSEQPHFYKFGSLKYHINANTFRALIRKELITHNRRDGRGRVIINLWRLTDLGRKVARAK